MYIVLLISSLFFYYVNSSLTTQYYEKLIQERIAQTASYVPPQSNKEFRTGAESNTTKVFDKFDFIIIGAGSAGSVLATRLSEVDDFDILLLEAGGEENDFSNIPGMYFFLQWSEMNWGYLSTPQKKCCLGMIEQRCTVPRGKSIGGSSAINSIMYVRGNPEDYNRWVGLGNPGWSYEEVLPYFKKSENSQIDGDAGYHGKGGLWNVEYSSPLSSLFKNFVDGSCEINASFVDYNGRQQFGSSQFQFNMKRGRRQSLGTAFLSDARKRRNLGVITKALVTKIYLDSDKKVAQGVEFIARNQKFSAFARKEILLCAGAINSPQLLILSGIGPKEHLEELGIEVIADLPVGENLIDHPLFPGLTFHTNYTQPLQSLEQQVKDYLEDHGALTTPANIQGIGFIPTTNKGAPTIEYMFIPPKNGSVSILSKIFNYNDTLTNTYINQIIPGRDLYIYIILLHERSRGRITLKSKDPLEFPNIDLNFFDKEEDIDDLVEGVEFIFKLAKTEAFKKINTSFVDISICSEFDKYSRRYWECAIRSMTATLYHPCGTTAMGPDHRTSVVDSNLKVHGIRGLRVVDAGVIPSTVSGHTNAPVVMIAEKMADVIKQKYTKKVFV